MHCDCNITKYEISGFIEHSVHFLRLHTNYICMTVILDSTLLSSKMVIILLLVQDQFPSNTFESKTRYVSCSFATLFSATLPQSTLKNPLHCCVLPLLPVLGHTAYKVFNQSPAIYDTHPSCDNFHSRHSSLSFPSIRNISVCSLSKLIFVPLL